MAAYIPDEIVASIMSRLPGKSISRFRCTCKSWLKLLEEPIFLELVEREQLEIEIERLRLVEREQLQIEIQHLRKEMRKCWYVRMEKLQAAEARFYD
ncbi:hypothetical protein C5167_027215 [Papaver somniferum]|nr:hypothetical protein C5167_027215 [Papaver somniferum]